MAPSLVTSWKLISATSFGFTQVTVAFGGSGRKREGLLYSGTSLKGHLLVFSGFNCRNKSVCILSVNPVPTGPTYLNSPSSYSPSSSALNCREVFSFFV